MADRRIKGSHGRSGRRLELEIPVSLELVLVRASEDEEFRTELLDDPGPAVERHGIEMKPSERAMLQSMSRGALETMIDGFRPSIHGRSRFARKVATAVAGSLVVGVVSCGEARSGEDVIIDAVGGVGPDMPWDVPVDPAVEEEADDPDDEALDAEDGDAEEDSADDSEESDG